MADDEPIDAGDLRHVVTTGGGWGDPLEREPKLVRLDVLRGLVSPGSAERDCGVIFTGPPDRPGVDEEGTAALRDRLRTERGPRPIFDHGPATANSPTVR